MGWTQVHPISVLCTDWVYGIQLNLQINWCYKEICVWGKWISGCPFPTLTYLGYQHGLEKGVGFDFFSFILNYVTEYLGENVIFLTRRPNHNTEHDLGERHGLCGKRDLFVSMLYSLSATHSFYLILTDSVDFLKGAGYQRCHPGAQWLCLYGVTSWHEVSSLVRWWVPSQHDRVTWWYYFICIISTLKCPNYLIFIWIVDKKHALIKINHRKCLMNNTFHTVFSFSNLFPFHSSWPGFFEFSLILNFLFLIYCSFLKWVTALMSFSVLLKYLQSLSLLSPNTNCLSEAFDILPFIVFFSHFLQWILGVDYRAAAGNRTVNTMGMTPVFADFAPPHSRFFLTS